METGSQSQSFRRGGRECLKTDRKAERQLEILSTAICVKTLAFEAEMEAQQTVDFCPHCGAPVGPCGNDRVRQNVGVAKTEFSIATESFLWVSTILFEYVQLELGGTVS